VTQFLRAARRLAFLGVAVPVILLGGLAWLGWFGAPVDGEWGQLGLDVAERFYVQLPLLLVPALALLVADRPSDLERLAKRRPWIVAAPLRRTVLTLIGGAAAVTAAGLITGYLALAQRQLYYSVAHPVAGSAERVITSDFLPPWYAGRAVFTG